MTQPKIKQLVKLLGEWSEFVASGRHERPDGHFTDIQAKEVSEPLAAEMYRLVIQQIKRWEA